MMVLVALLCGLACALAAFLVFWRFYFLRDPERTIRRGRTIVSPADGKVIAAYSHTEAHQTISKHIMGKIDTLCADVDEHYSIISIFMSPLDVHINRMPMAGKVRWIHHESGSLRPVNSLDSGLRNEKTEVLLDSSIGKIKVIQVAGFLARRIRCDLRKGDRVRKGQRYGLINLGSQLIVILPRAAQLTVSTGNRVRAGESIIARYERA